MYVGVEYGGQTTRVVICSIEGPFSNFAVYHFEEIKTETGEVTVNKVADILSSYFNASLFKSDQIGLGIASFGPINSKLGHERYGTILDTPKEGWSGTDVCSSLVAVLKPHASRIFSVVSSDVAAPAKMWSKITGKDTAYMTIGTGIGIGFSTPDLNGEFGHFRVEKNLKDKNFESCCKFHRKYCCCKGLAAAPALAHRLGCCIGEIQNFVTNEIVEIEADYISQACANAILVSDVEQIVIGGGIARMEGLIDMVSKQLNELNGGYRKECKVILDPGVKGYASGIISAVYSAYALTAFHKQ